MNGVLRASVWLGLLCASVAEARVTRFVIEERTPFADGISWSRAGAYERLKGTAYMEVNPADPLNAVIVNLDKAPRNERGMVEFHAPFVVLKPVAARGGNGKIWYGINNRGFCMELGIRSFPNKSAASCNPATAEKNNILLQEGYTWVDAGWQGDGITQKDGERLYPTFPIARNSDGSSIVGTARLEYQLDTPGWDTPLVSDRAGRMQLSWRPYPTASGDTGKARLTVRDRQDAPRTRLSGKTWAFGKCPDGPASFAPAATDLCIFDGLKANKIYELTYSAKDPIVMGLAYAVTRDIASFLRFEEHDDAGSANPLAGMRRVYSSGTSSTAMYLREFLYLGFNEDEKHRRVFDGVTIYSAGAYRLFANSQFSHPSFYSRQDAHQDYPAYSAPPFAFAVTTDPLTGHADGILKRPATDPFVIQIDEEEVFWQWQASLNIVDSNGRPIPIPDNVRLYHQNGFGHIGASGLLAPPSSDEECVNPTQSAAAMAVTIRAFVSILDDWVDKGISPPASRYPRIDDGSLVSLREYRREFPKIPQLVPPNALNELFVLDFGPRFGPAGGIQTVIPPQRDGQYRIWVPKPTGDGFSAAGIHTIWTRAPLGTNVGWNVQPGSRAPDLCRLFGSFVPFAATKAQRVASADPRPSLEERYGNHEGFVAAVQAAASELVRERFLLQQDAEAFVSAARDSTVLR